MISGCLSQRLHRHERNAVQSAPLDIRNHFGWLPLARERDMGEPLHRLQDFACIHYLGRSPIVDSSVGG
jgi:hypothetical protein